MLNKRAELGENRSIPQSVEFARATGRSGCTGTGTGTLRLGSGGGGGFEEVARGIRGSGGGGSGCVEQDRQQPSRAW